MKFPERVYTKDEVQRARILIEQGYKHELRVKGSRDFESKVEKALELIKMANYYDFLRTYIREIVEIDGLSQLRESEVAIWVNKYSVTDPVEAAGFLIQKAQQMKDYTEGRLYYDRGEIRAVNKRIEFLETLKERSTDQALKKRCEEILKAWTETTYP
jgi:hypothetical protein